MSWRSEEISPIIDEIACLDFYALATPYFALIRVTAFKMTFEVKTTRIT